MSGYHGRLELTWTNKEKRLLAYEDGSYVWAEPSDYRVAEVRLLDDVRTVGDVSPTINRANDNLLIRGDALYALNSLIELPEFADKYVGKVKLAYLDPPFNTQQSFLQYDDAIEHSVWLTMMRDRLLSIRTLLSSEGSVWVHCDDSEQAYLKVMMDEVFGRENFVATVVWEKADSPRNSARQFSVDHDYLMVYSKDPNWKPFRLPRTAEADVIYANPDDDPRGDWFPGDPFANKPYSKGEYSITGPTGRVFSPPPGRYWRISKERFDDLDADGQIWWGPTNDARPSIKRFLAEVADLVPRTIWAHEDVGSNRRSKNEMRALFPGVASFATPKPEALIARVLNIASAPGDTILDCFLGSGTTAAVAHKMHRRWVAVERESQTLDRFTIPRLTRVVLGEDPGGITREVGWEGGGGFRILDVAPSIFEAAGGQVFLRDWATDTKLAEATAAQLGFNYAIDPPFHGHKGRTRLVVVDGLVNGDVVRLLVRALADDELLMVCGTAADPQASLLLSELRRGSRLRKIPQSILQEYRQPNRWQQPVFLDQASDGSDKSTPLAVEARI